MEHTLWDVEVGKQLGHFTDEQEALVLASTPVAHYGAGHAYDRGPGRRTESGSIMEPLLGAALLACS